MPRVQAIDYGAHAAAPAAPWRHADHEGREADEVREVREVQGACSLFELKNLRGLDLVYLYFGPSAPSGQESRWIKTVPGRGWFAYIRIYGPEQAAFDESWKPGDFEEIK